jgi:penicillin G amidase
MPAVVDPAEGFVVAANQAVTPAGEGPFLTADWDYGYRAQRLRTLLEEALDSGQPIDLETSRLLQLDDHNPYAELLVPYLLDVPVEDPFTRDGLAVLDDWDYRQDVDSAGAAYFAAVWATLLELTFWDDLPQEQWPSGDSRWLAVVARLLEQPDSEWWDDRRTVAVVESRDEILARSLEAARLRLTVEMGKQPQDWRWGRVHVAAPRHPVLGGEAVAGPIRSLVNPRPRAVAGGSSIVNATAWDASTGSFEVTAAPSMRMVVDMSDPDAASWVTVTGTSGHPGSSHYADQFEAWAAGEQFAWPFSQEAVEQAAQQTLTLRPAR